MNNQSLLTKLVARIRFRTWFATATDPSGAPLSDLYSLDHLRIVLPGDRADLPAWEIADRHVPILAARYDAAQRHFDVASFTVAEAGPTLLRIKLYDIFRLDPEDMAYSRDSLGVPVELTFDFERRDFTTEMEPPNCLTPDEIELLWSLLGQGDPSLAQAD